MLWIHWFLFFYLLKNIDSKIIQNQYVSQFLHLKYISPTNSSEFIDRYFVVEANHINAREFESPKEVANIAFHFKIPYNYYYDPERTYLNTLAIDPIQIQKLNCPLGRKLCEIKAINRILQPVSLTNIEYLGRYINPSLIVWHDRLLLAGETTMHAAENDTLHLRRIGFHWFNHTEYPFYDDKPYLGINSTANEMTYFQEHIIGQDPRLLLLPNQSILMTFTRHDSYVSHRNLRVGSTILSLNPKNQEIYYHEVNQALDPDHHPSKPHKNYMSFLDKHDSLYFIEGFNPMYVSTIASDQYRYSHVAQHTYFGKQLQTKYFNGVYIKWLFGFIRGGSNPLLINEQESLVFFHSFRSIEPKDAKEREKFKGMPRGTYYLGALTFSNIPPFRPIAYTPFPLIAEQFYSGKPMKMNIDYVIFPTSSMFSKKNTSEILVTVGSQDRDAWLLRFSKEILLNSLKPVSYDSSVLENTEFPWSYP